jgi:hypothetical protein
MKRSELKVGDELYWAKPHDWQKDYTGKKVTVLHVEPYGRDEYGRREIRKEYSGKGNGVHVRVDHPGFNYGEEVVRLGDLRGPYAATLAEVEARQDAKRLALIEAQTARRTTDNVRNHAIRRADATGHRFAAAYGPSSQNLVTTTVETLGAMLDRIEALQADVSRLEDDITTLRVEMSGAETPGLYGEQS